MKMFSEISCGINVKCHILPQQDLLGKVVCLRGIIIQPHVRAVLTTSIASCVRCFDAMNIAKNSKQRATMT
jgi:hypothetical protein